eukprot:355650-Chlamydomonas_euryale.AAC.4
MKGMPRCTTSTFELWTEAVYGSVALTAQQSPDQWSVQKERNCTLLCAALYSAPDQRFSSIATTHGKGSCVAKATISSGHAPAPGRPRPIRGRPCGHPLQQQRPSRLVPPCPAHRPTRRAARSGAARLELRRAEPPRPRLSSRARPAVQPRCQLRPTATTPRRWGLLRLRPSSAALRPLRRRLQRRRPRQLQPGPQPLPASPAGTRLPPR